MTNDKVNSVLWSYFELLKGMGFGPARRREMGDDFYPGTSRGLSAAHCMWMCREAASWPAERLEKKFRWLGFVQGTMWSFGWRSIEEMKKDSMPDAEAK